MTLASKRTWHGIADRPKEMGLSPRGEGNLPRWLLNVVPKSRDPKLTELVAKLMSQGLDLNRMKGKRCSVQIVRRRAQGVAASRAIPLGRIVRSVPDTWPFDG